MDEDILDESIEEEKPSFPKKLFVKDSFLDRLNKRIRFTPFLLICPILIISIVWRLYTMTEEQSTNAGFLMNGIILVLFLAFLFFVIDRILAHLASQKVVVILECGVLLFIFIWIFGGI